MTCIISLCHDGRVYMAGDRQRTSGNLYSEGPVAKVIKKGNTIRAGCGAAWLSDEFRLRFSPDDYDGKTSPDDYIYETVVPELYNYLKTRDYLLKDSEHDHQLLMGVGSKLYSLHISHRVVAHQVKGFKCIGSGGDIALGALAATRSDIDNLGAVPYLKKLIKLVSSLDVYCNATADIVST